MNNNIDANLVINEYKGKHADLVHQNILLQSLVKQLTEEVEQLKQEAKPYEAVEPAD